MIFKFSKVIKTEIDKTNDLIRDIVYNNEILFRPPYGKKLFTLPFYLNKVSQTTAMWNLEPESYSEVNKDAESIPEYVINNVKNVYIILLHPMNDKTDKIANAIRSIVIKLKEEGYSFELLENIN